jgi:hypothetical protein
MGGLKKRYESPVQSSFDILRLVLSPFSRKPVPSLSLKVYVHMCVCACVVCVRGVHVCACVCTLFSPVCRFMCTTYFLEARNLQDARRLSGPLRIRTHFFHSWSDLVLLLHEENCPPMQQYATRYVWERALATKCMICSCLHFCGIL